MTPHPDAESEGGARGWIRPSPLRVGKPLPGSDPARSLLFANKVLLAHSYTHWFVYCEKPEQFLPVIFLYIQGQPTRALVYQFLIVVA